MSRDAMRGPSARAKARRALGLAAGLALAAALLAVAGVPRVLDALRGARWGWAGLALPCYAAFFALRGARWRLLLGPGGAGAGTAALLTAAGWLVSTAVPLKAGDVLRAAWMARRHGAGLGAVAGSVALERALDVVGLALASSAALLLLHRGGAGVPARLGDLVAVAWALPPLGLAVLVLLGLLVPPARRTNAALRFAGQLLDQVPALLRRPRLLLPAAALTALAVALQSSVIALLALAFLPHAAPLAAFAGAPLFLLTFAVAVTPGHLGTYEAGFALVYSALGLGSAAALVPVAVAVHLLTASIVALLGGLAFGALWALAQPLRLGADEPAGREARP